MELKLNIKDNYDLTLLLSVINSTQDRVVTQHARNTALLKDQTEQFKDWFDETINEWNRLQNIKKQIAFKLENTKE